MSDPRVVRGLPSSSTNLLSTTQTSLSSTTTRSALDASSTGTLKRSTLGRSAEHPLEVTARHRGPQPWHAKTTAVCGVITSGITGSRATTTTSRGTAIATRIAAQVLDLTPFLTEKCTPPATADEGTETDEFWPLLPEHVLNKVSALSREAGTDQHGSSWWDTQRVQRKTAPARARAAPVMVDAAVEARFGDFPGDAYITPAAVSDGDPSVEDPAVVLLRNTIIEFCRPEDAAPLLRQLDAATAAQIQTERAHARELSAVEERLYAARAARKIEADAETAALEALLTAARSRAIAVTAARETASNEDALQRKLAAVDAARRIIGVDARGAAIAQLSASGFFIDPVASAVRSLVVPALLEHLERSSGSAARETATALLDKLLERALGAEVRQPV